ncbi:TetR/AcrR family transcriptional regulator [Frankia sp. CNm7]|uniref:TetR/AcrR family transcriptional regulator n=1 Tax=Frankia nepalensis TaxID=1836974 RepID=A0A937RBS2_9ACTN|nr:TetR/AcrR family transcriptional regulator [Frankia nepalensis]MBL7496643.1 TetR/AcrR family transcriptional regulator [Frankia nepalensis]MBL7511901.1 TetR/AcrR family transcriptional regulator [Frankia nepalensis]MBL7516652.1 TetR/AcrR family transcriptional regulator [Frankia nepalensis]MBL7627382.1 TetR/AcrR family transcriptional regulator [Frankia nepalensis]
MTSEGTRQRRPRGEPRRLLIEAAVELFNARGYGVPTREIADRADVSETLMFRYFGSKAGLFREAMVKPFTDFVDAFVAEYERGAQPDDDLFEITLDFVGQLFDLFRSHRGLVAAVWGNASAEGSDLTAAAVEEDVWAAFGKLVRVGRLAQAGRPARNEIATRAIVSMVAGMAVADRAFEGRALPSRDLIVYEIAQIATYGRVRWDSMPLSGPVGQESRRVTPAG